MISLALSLLIGPALLIALFVAMTQPARAAGYVVTNTNDSGAGSLREALHNANASAGADVISFNLTGCPCAIALSSRLDITGALTLSGPGASQLALDGGHAVQVIRTTDVPVSISGITIRNGLAITPTTSGGRDLCTGRVNPHSGNGGRKYGC